MARATPGTNTISFSAPPAAVKDEKFRNECLVRPCCWLWVLLRRAGKAVTLLPEFSAKNT